MPCKMQARASVGIIQHRLQIRAVMNTPLPPPTYSKFAIYRDRWFSFFFNCFIFFLFKFKKIKIRKKLGVVSFLAGLSLRF